MSKATETAESDHKCPKCGFVMCEQFDEKPQPSGVIYVVPNGKYICYHCEQAGKEK